MKFNIEKLSMSLFDGPIGVLPETLRELLSLGFTFNHPIEKGVLPVSLDTLSMGRSFNMAIEPKVRPKKVEVDFLCEILTRK